MAEFEKHIAISEAGLKVSKGALLPMRWAVGDCSPPWSPYHEMAPQFDLNGYIRLGEIAKAGLGAEFKSNHPSFTAFVLGHTVPEVIVDLDLVQHLAAFFALEHDLSIDSAVIYGDIPCPTELDQQIARGRLAATMVMATAYDNLTLAMPTPLKRDVPSLGSKIDQRWHYADKIETLLQRYPLPKV